MFNETLRTEVHTGQESKATSARWC